MKELTKLQEELANSVASEKQYKSIAAAAESALADVRNKMSEIETLSLKRVESLQKDIQASKADVGSIVSG